jgi:hypothetical protein
MKRKESRNPTRTGAFTLIDLMAVVVIVSLVVGMVVGCSRHGRVSKTVAWIDMLKAGCETYRSQYGFYPGQDPYWASQLDKKAYTGSQVLCITLLGPSGDAEGGNVMPSSFAEPYAHYWDTVANSPTSTKRVATGTDAGTVNTTVADKFEDPMPILYYPARLGGTGLDQFVMSDNSVYCNASNDPKSTFTNQDNFNTYITDPSKPKGTPFQAGGFILISAGADRVYGMGKGGAWTGNPADHFECDDIRNYSDSRN